MGSGRAIRGGSASARGTTALLALALMAVAAGMAGAATLQLTETGSTLIFPLLQSWGAAYQKVAPDVALATAATGSGAGIEQAIAGKVRIGASDAYMSDDQAMANPHILNIPLAISAQMVSYNLPGLHALRLSGAVLAAIYSGSVRNWDAPQIAALNPGAALPHHAIVPVRRADASGDTFIFTQFLSFSTPEWEDRTGYGTTIAWPAVPDALTAEGNAAMVELAAKTPFSVAYIGASFQDSAARAGLGTALLENQAGKFLLPTAATVTAAADVLTPRTPPDERLTLAFAPGPDSYPLVNYEYAVVSNRQPDAQTAAAIRGFLLWSIDPAGGNAAQFLGPVHFIALPTNVRAMSEMQIATIH